MSMLFLTEKAQFQFQWNMEWAQIVYHDIENNIRSKLTWEFADIVMNSISNLVLTAIAVQETTHPRMKIQLIHINPYVTGKTLESQK